MILDNQPISVIYHLAVRHEWEAAVASGHHYCRSTIGRSLDEQGYIHASFRHQVDTVAEAFYHDCDDVVLLEIEVSGLNCEVKVENLDGGAERFPHIYGPIPVDAVSKVETLDLMCRKLTS